MTTNRPAKSIDTERETLLKAAQSKPGILELMEVYEAAEAVYTATMTFPPVRVATSTTSA